MKEALLYRQLDSNRVACRLCAHFCVIAEGRRGWCGVRENRAGKLYSLVYGYSISRNVDPIEKKPLYHFHPGSRAFSIATPGCNMHCHWCQNWQISQVAADQPLPVGETLAPERIVSLAQQSGCRSIAYTYTEPTVFFEYCLATARLARAAGIANVLVSNGYMSAEMLELLHPWLDGANIDLKAFRDATYRTYTGARLQPVLDSLKRLRDYGVWLEVTTLIIPGINDDPGELQEMAGFIAGELGADTPWHISRFHPQYQLSHLPPTPVASIHAAVEAGRSAGLNYVYCGNLATGNATCCPNCGAVLIDRNGGYDVRSNRVSATGACPACAQAIAGVAMAG